MPSGKLIQSKIQPLRPINIPWNINLPTPGYLMDGTPMSFQEFGEDLNISTGNKLHNSTYDATTIRRHIIQTRQILSNECFFVGGSAAAARICYLSRHDKNIRNDYAAVNLSLFGDFDLYVPVTNVELHNENTANDFIAQMNRKTSLEPNLVHHACAPRKFLNNYYSISNNGIRAGFRIYFGRKLNTVPSRNKDMYKKNTGNDLPSGIVPLIYYNHIDVLFYRNTLSTKDVLNTFDISVCQSSTLDFQPDNSVTTAAFHNTVKSKRITLNNRPIDNLEYHPYVSDIYKEHCKHQTNERLEKYRTRYKKLGYQ